MKFASFTPMNDQPGLADRKGRRHRRRRAAAVHRAVPRDAAGAIRAPVLAGLTLALSFASRA
jgi:hypothetical protein